MLYIVHINYTEFTFHDPHTAMSFAELGKNYCEGDPTVKIELVLDEPVIDDISEALEEEEE